MTAFKYIYIQYVRLGLTKERDEDEYILRKWSFISELNSFQYKNLTYKIVE